MSLSPNLLYYLGTAAAVFSSVSLVLSAICSSSNQCSSSSTRLIDSAAIALSALGCIVLLALILIFLGDRFKKSDPPQRRAWKTNVYYLGTAYLLFVAALANGTMARDLTTASAAEASPGPNPLSMARNVAWSVSVFFQGLFCGALVPSLEEPRHYSDDWPRPFSPEGELGSHNSDLRRKPSSSLPSSSTYESQRYSMSNSPKDRLTPVDSNLSRSGSRFSKRYSGLTLFRRDSKRSSIESQPTQESPPLESPPVTHAPESELAATPAATSTEVTPASTDGPGPTLVSEPSVDDPAPSLLDRPRPLVLEDRGLGRRLHRSASQIKRSLDTLISPALPSPTITVSSEPDSPRTLRAVPAFIPDERNIHPLFRSGSPTPPTALPGTVVTAAPTAGQTVTVKSARKMRSNTSLRANATRSRTSLLERSETVSERGERRSRLNDTTRTHHHHHNNNPNHDNNNGLFPGIVLAADVRRSLLRYEKRYNLDESPEES
ncbi:hypothetical protein ASPZODRAFT_13557 [Penicilliopsis zonata CBS 506.65]|uniref:Uncharacterized protein n=1 Tax=Penicilliopsis zonata CBS 506.65 TaxID=1073090 RepID=A0A1L9SNW9_9EURO|nr:hypothetical protein ASPZODRAFT_13557 [Penicilliopsis zonata CBS 506.65]OJJ48816.1 hypothetical protein ASPZODRAFT_13557 [Penicilliopsis zonata CBS 506.65]